MEFPAVDEIAQRPVLSHCATLCNQSN